MGTASWSSKLPVEFISPGCSALDAGLVLIGGVDRSGPWELSVVISPALTYEHNSLTEEKGKAKLQKIEMLKNPIKFKKTTE